MQLVNTTTTEEDSVVTTTLTGDTVEIITEAITEVAKITKCPAKTTNPHLEE